MPRIRTVKPEFWQDTRMSKLPSLERLVFLCTFSMSDDEGRIEGDAEAVWTFGRFREPVSEVARALRVLAELSRVVLYEVAGNPYIQVCNFLKHQKIDKPTPSKFPAHPNGYDLFAERSSNARRGLDDGSVSVSVSGSVSGSGSGPGSGSGHRLGKGSRSTRKRRGATKPTAGSRLPSDWTPSPELKAFAASKRPDLSFDETVAKFRDYFTAAPGVKGRKLDWNATFRNWVRNEPRGRGASTLAERNRASVDEAIRRFEEERPGGKT